MMTVGDIGDRHLRKSTDKRFIPVGHAPHRVADAVGGGELVKRSLLHRLFHQTVQFRCRAIGQENGTRVGVQLARMTRTVVLLVLSRLLVAQNDLVGVIINRATADDTGLNMGSHHLLIEVKARFGLAEKDTTILK